MNVETEFKVAKKNALVEELLEYNASPGSYALALGQPDRVFQSLDTVISWAMGRVTDKLGAQDSKLQQAAIFFVLRACFRQENTYYEVMGLGRHFKLDTLRTRYRSLISLTHPDKGVTSLPTNAAERVNQAYEVLRDPDLRREYDLKLQDSLVKVHESTPLAALTFAPYKLTLKDRLQAVQANNAGVFRTMLFVVPVVFVGVALVLITSQNPSDQQLVAKSSLTEKYELDIRSLEPPKPMVALNTNPLKSDYDSLTQSSIYRPLVNSNEGHGKIISSEPQENYLRRARVKEGVAPQKVVATLETTARDQVKSPDAASNLSNDMVKPGIATTAESNTPLNLKFASALQVMPEVKRLASQYNDARLLVTNLMLALERPNDAEAWQTRMKLQGVSGNLFGLALPHLRQLRTIKIDQLVLKEQVDNNRLRLQGSVVLWLGTSVNQLMPVKFAVFAEFKDIESGPTLSRFDLKETQQ